MRQKFTEPIKESGLKPSGLAVSDRESPVHDGVFGIEPRFEPLQMVALTHVVDLAKDPRRAPARRVETAEVSQCSLLVWEDSGLCVGIFSKIHYGVVLPFGSPRPAHQHHVGNDHRQRGNTNQCNNAKCHKEIPRSSFAIVSKLAFEGYAGNRTCESRSECSQYCCCGWVAEFCQSMRDAQPGDQCHRPAHGAPPSERRQKISPRSFVVIEVCVHLKPGVCHDVLLKHTHSTV